MISFYDREGMPISADQHAGLQRNWSYKCVARSYFRDVIVSTVWLGLDHGFGCEERPVVFETMVFDSEVNNDGLHPSMSEFTRRYTTVEDALQGHVEVLEEVQGLFNVLLDLEMESGK